MATFFKIPGLVFSDKTLPKLPHDVGVPGATHRWVPELQPDTVGSSMGTLTDQVGTMSLAAMSSGTRPVGSDGLGKFVSNGGMDGSGFSTSMVIPAGAKTFSLVVRTASGSLSSYAAQIGGFNVNRGGSAWQIYQSGSANSAYGGPASGGWDHLLFVWDGTAGHAYLNGAKTSATALTSEGAVSGTLLIKGSGKVDLREVVVWDRALTTTEIADHRAALKKKWSDLS